MSDRTMRQIRNDLYQSAVANGAPEAEAIRAAATVAFQVKNESKSTDR